MRCVTRIIIHPAAIVVGVVCGMAINLMQGVGGYPPTSPAPGVWVNRKVRSELKRAALLFPTPTAQFAEHPYFSINLLMAGVSTLTLWGHLGQSTLAQHMNI